ncbi:hypothetical protein AX15_003668 [Amanita polypyramis BW_CC]|nr:hypothetical protein AX15_003668 [Amanita polypyramis BW_CC]
MNKVVYVAVHGGAGNHGRANDKATKEGLRQACIRAISCARQEENFSVLSVVESAISTLEDDPKFNAGYGSNLTLDGRVECDASIMDGCTSDFGSVGAVSGIKNPISLARCVLAHSRTPDKLGRLPPMTLVSDGAQNFVNSTRPGLCIQLVNPDDLVTPRAKDEWTGWKNRLTSESAEIVNEERTTGLYDLQDTVGAVAWVEGEGGAAGVSSGGLLLKYSGRISEAAVYGAGCWAQAGMACSVSGAGEHIVRAALARAVGEAFMISGGIDPHEILYRALIEKFWNPCKARGEPNTDAGLILLTKNGDSESVRLWCAFTTPSMAIAYASTLHPVPRALILRRPPELDNKLSDKPRIYVTAVTLS